MSFLYLAILIPFAGLVYAGFVSWLKYRQHLAMLTVLKAYAERGDEPPAEVLAALTKGFALSEPGVNAPNKWSAHCVEPSAAEAAAKQQGPAHYWSLVGLFAMFAAGFGYAAYLDGPSGMPFMIVAFTMGGVGLWALIMAIALSHASKK